MLKSLGPRPKHCPPAATLLGAQAVAHGLLCIVTIVLRQACSFRHMVRRGCPTLHRGRAGWHGPRQVRALTLRRLSGLLEKGDPRRGELAACALEAAVLMRFPVRPLLAQRAPS